MRGSATGLRRRLMRVCFLWMLRAMSSWGRRRWFLSSYSPHALHRTLLKVASSRDCRHTLVEFVPHCACTLV